MCEGVLNLPGLQKLARRWLLEDTANFDHAAAAFDDRVCEFTIFQKSPGILAGVPFVDAVFSELGLRAQWLVTEGQCTGGGPSQGTTPSFLGSDRRPIAVVRGSARCLLQAERVVLNILSRASGVATSAARMLSLVRGWPGRLAGSRKTTPGFRQVEKYALLVAGADPHRFDLSGMVMLKDNHLALAGSIEEAVRRARKSCGFTSKIEVECQSLQQAKEACLAGCDIIMFDNLEPKDFLEASEQLKDLFPNILIEASGGITAKNIMDYISPCTDIISSSSLVQGYETVDFSMKVTKASIAAVEAKVFGNVT